MPEEGEVYWEWCGLSRSGDVIPATPFAKAGDGAVAISMLLLLHWNSSHSLSAHQGNHGWRREMH